MPLQLTTPEVAEVCSHLQIPDLGGSYIPHGYLERAPDERLEEASDKAYPRTRFITACHNLAYRMIVARTPPEELIEVAFSDNPLP